jgi:putative glycerol-1-phosphate prenyltransferase
MNKKLFAVLIDPDKCEEAHLSEIFHSQQAEKFDWILVGGSILESGSIENCIHSIRKFSYLPIVIFPGDPSQICAQADALLLLALVSGRNPEYLIGHHVNYALELRKSQLELISTAYLLINTGTKTAVSTTTNTDGILAANLELIKSTALASEQLGYKCIYLEAGSGSSKPISEKIISEVRATVDIPIIVGGGLKNFSALKTAWNAGADMVVVGTALEQNPSAFDL